jgi:hypothetical protein
LGCWQRGLNQQAGIAPLFPIARQICHLTGASRGDPVVEKIGMGGGGNGHNVTERKAKRGGMALGRLGQGMGR